MASGTTGAIAGMIHELFSEGTVAGLSDGQLLEQYSTHDGDAGRLAFTALVKRQGPMWTAYGHVLAGRNP